MIMNMKEETVNMVTLLNGIINLIQRPQEDGEELSMWVLERALIMRDELLLGMGGEANE
tara:strand:- start:184 stop:360 length:177 start_codon:yes stop_codon:yes gene_type:complete